MSWTYHQESGELVRNGQVVSDAGYSGHGDGVNNPDMEGVRNVGPIPRGRYSIGEQYDTTNHGPHVMALTPVGHNALGRDHFLIHGDNSAMNQTASEGCIILPRAIRDAIAESGDDDLYVVP